MTQAPAAHRAMAASEHIGKILLVTEMTPPIAPAGAGQRCGSDRLGE